VVQLARLRVLGEGDVMHLLAAGQPDRRVRVAVGCQHALDEIEAEHLGEDLLHFGHVRTIEQRVVKAHRGDAVIPRLRPGGRVDQRDAVADLGLLGIELHHVTGRQLETDALAGLQHLTRRNAGRLQAIGLQIGIEFVEGGYVEDAEAEEVDSRTVRFANHVAAVVALVPALEIHPPLRVAPGFHQPQHVAVKAHALLEIQHSHLRMPRSQNTCHCHRFVSSDGCEIGRFRPFREALNQLDLFKLHYV